MYEVVIVILLLVAIALVALILVQQGKGAGMGASFGAGASNTVFGSTGSGNFLTRSTWICVILFFGICLLIGYMQKNHHSENADFSNLDDVPAVESPVDVPVVTDNDGEVPVVTDIDVPAVDADAKVEDKVEETTATETESANKEENSKSSKEENAQVENTKDKK